MKRFLLKTIFLLFTFTFNALPYSFAQFTSINLTSGVLFSDIQQSDVNERLEKERNAVDNAVKRGFAISIGSSYQFSKRISLDFNLSYQERLPLEIFTYGGEHALSVNIIAGYPTSPQSKLWNPNEHLRFPNFKYAYSELTPMANFGKKINTSLGIGIFYGYLMNHKKLVFGEADFPADSFLFTSALQYSGVDAYRKHDLGWTPRIITTFPLNENLSIRAAIKGYISQIELKKFEEPDFIFNRSLSTNWNAVSIEVGVDFKINNQ